ncbi:MAG: DUF3014 domain-containing protein [Lentisphaeria bacterium]|nr:DUF3014 domain-containing protein [Lentisphaeria bacterium]
MSLPWRTILAYGLPPVLAGVGLLSYYLWPRSDAPAAAVPPSEYSVPGDSASPGDSVVPLPPVDPALVPGGEGTAGATASPIPSPDGATPLSPGTLTSTEPLTPLTLVEAEAALPELAATLSADPSWGQWLQQGKLLQRLVRALDDIALGEIPLPSCAFLRSREPFTASKQGGRITQSTASTKRYDAVVNGFCAIDPAAAAALFDRLEPAVQEAVNALGYRDRSVRDLLRSAMTTILAVPVPASAPELVTNDGKLYRWADLELEALSDVQKLFLRLGTDNMLKVRQQITLLADAARIDVK